MVAELEIAAWRRERRSGGRIRCTPPGGAATGEIVIHERVRPLASIRALADERAPGKIVTAAQIVTAEGELGAIVEIESGSHHDFLGVAYGDDFQMIVHGRTSRLDQRARIHAATRELVEQLPLGLGRGRHRWFWYRPPPGWQGLARGLVTDWYPPDHPRNPATIKVLPARPLDGRLDLDTFLRDDTFTGIPLDEVTRTPLSLGAFHGTLGRATGAGRAYLTVLLEDKQHAYVLRLTTSIDRILGDEEIFQAVIRSCAPLPTRDRVPAAVTRALDYWTT